MILSKTDSPHLRVRIGSSVDLPPNAERAKHRADTEGKQEADGLFRCPSSRRIYVFECFPQKKQEREREKNMASSKEFLNFVLEQCSELTARPMMGEYVIYFRGKVVGGIYDNRFLLKQSAAAKTFLKSAEAAVPYKGAKEMLVLDNLDDRELLKDLLEAMI